MCYGTCKYEYNFGPHELTGECSIPFKILGTNDMPDDAVCIMKSKEEVTMLGEYRNLGYVGVDEIQGESEVSHAFYLPKCDTEEVLDNIAADVDEVLDTLEEQGQEGIKEAIEMLVELNYKLTGNVR